MIESPGTIFAELRRTGTALPAFNVYDTESVHAVFDASRESAYPAMLAFGERYLSHAGFAEMASLVSALAETFPYPVILHLDHCQHVEQVKQAVDCGFLSVMYDGSALPFDENSAATKQVTAYAHQYGAAVEGELGYLNRENEDMASEPSPDMFTTPEQAVRYVSETGVDTLAVSVGNAHGIYKGTPNLDLDRLRQIAECVPVPLVLHGCSGIPFNLLASAITAGVVKINVNTETSLAATAAIRNLLNKSGGTATIRFEELLLAARTGMKNVMQSWIEVCKNPSTEKTEI